MQLETIHPKEHPSSLTFRNKYDSRLDLTPEIRVKIGLIAEYGNRHGRMTRLAERYGLSRTTVHSIHNQLKQVLTDGFSKPSPELVDKIALREASIRQMVLQRVVGQSSLSGISTILKENGYSPDSPGFISETLHLIGDKLPQVIDYQGTMVWVCDEIFHLGSVPILITVEPISGAIIQIQTHEGGLKEGWLDHWHRAIDLGITPSDLSTDEGWLMRAARLDLFKEYPNTGFQPDSFHAVSHRLGLFRLRLEKAANKAIEAEYEREWLCEHTKTPGQLPKFEQQWLEASLDAEKAIAAYDQFSILYRSILDQLNIFDQNGEPRQRAIAESETLCAIKMMKDLAIPRLNKELDSLLKLVPNLFRFLDKANECCQKMIENNLIPAHWLPFWCKAWQYQKQSFKIKGNYPYQQWLKQKAKNWLDWIELHTIMFRAQFNELKDTIFKAFETIVQSSAAVEMVNSVLRPFLNISKDQLSQQALNLIMDYYNHKRFNRGKRKGKSPIEILTGQTHKQPWLDRIMDIVRIHHI